MIPDFYRPNFQVQFHAMKRLFVLFLFLPVILPAQANGGHFDTLPAGAIGIDLPEVKYYLRYQGNEYVIRQDADYKSLFHDSTHALLPVIDFNKYELVGTVYCLQCLTVCPTYKPCHRSGCDDTRMWYLLNKQHHASLSYDTLEVGNRHAPSYVRDGFACEDDSAFANLQRLYPELKDDSVDFTKQLLLTRAVSVDCMARTEQELYLDTVNRCVVWRLFTAYGGCHGSVERNFFITIPQPPTGYEVRFEEFTFADER